MSMDGICELAELAKERFEKLRDQSDSSIVRLVDRNEGNWSPKVEFYPFPRIDLPIKYVEYVWAVAYYFIVVQEEIQLEEEDPNWDGTFLMTTGVRNQAKLVFKWAMDFLSYAQAYPSSYPTPADGAKTGSREAIYCGMANTVAIFAVCHVLFHESGHIVGDHENIAKLRRDVYDSSQDKLARTILIQAETEADNFALGSMIQTDDSERTILNNSLGILTGIIAVLFTNKTIKRDDKWIHANADERLRRALEFVAWESQRHHDYVFQLASNALISWFEQHGIDWPDQDRGSIEERFFSLLGVFDESQDLWA